MNLCTHLFDSKKIIPKESLSDLRQRLTTEKPLKMMKNPFHFILEALFVFEKFTFLF